MREQFFVKLEEIGINNFITDINRNLNEITKDEIIKKIQQTIIMEYDIRTIMLHDIKDSLYKAILPIFNRPKTEDEKANDVIMFKNNKAQAVHQMIVCDDIEENYLLGEYEIMVYPYKTEHGIFIQTVSGSDKVNKAITMLGEDWNIQRATLQVITNCSKKYKPVLIKPNFIIFNSEMKEIDDELMDPIKRAKELLNDIEIWSKYYDDAVSNMKNTRGDRATVGDIMEEGYRIICSQIEDTSWDDILSEEF